MRHIAGFDGSRRRFIAGAAATAAILASPAFAGERTGRAEQGRALPAQERKPAAKPAPKEPPQPKADTIPVTPPEDLMREHGVLRRVLLVYAAIGESLAQGREVKPETISSAAGIVRRVVEDYHEQLEETYVFARFRSANQMASFVDLLTLQHQQGRVVTDSILADATSETLASPEGRQRVIEHIGAFTRMYRPHAAREDTVLFPALRSVTTPKDFQDMGTRFEAKEEEILGPNGFTSVVSEVAALEQELGIFDLSQFAPQA